MKRSWKARPRLSSDLLTQLLRSRGVEGEAEKEFFFDPRYESSYDPFLLCDMEKAVRRIRQAVERGEKITVYADYDADAITAAAVILRFLRHLGHGSADHYIPDRFSEGYGVNREAIAVLKDKGTSLIITVDCGANAVEAADFANSLGIDVIITDHHLITGSLPRACAVINPHRPDDQYPFKDLTGVGVAFKFTQALIQSFGRPGFEKWLLDLVAIGTVADCQSVLGENRIFIKWGLLVLQKTRWAGLRQLLGISGLKDSVLDTYHLGFIIAPRLNAAGRIEHGNLALELLLTDDPAQGLELAEKLDELNRRRRVLTEQILSEAREQIALRRKDKILLAAGSGWSRGVVGLVAGRLSEEYFRPVLVLDKGEKEAVGSARSVGSFNIVLALSQSREWLTKFGGHSMAAGFTLPSEHIEPFHKNLLEFAETALSEDDTEPVVEYDAEISFKEITHDFLESLDSFAPFGQGNTRPRFCLRNGTVKASTAVGREGKHLRVRLEAGGQIFSGIGFNQGYLAAKLFPGTSVDLICEPGFNEWNGAREPQLKIIDINLLS